MSATTIDTSGGLIVPVPAWPASLATSGLPRVFCNTRPGVDANTCGQAAIATVAAYFRRGPFMGPSALDDGAGIDRVREDFAPDVPFGLGTSAWRIADALRGYGLRVERVHSGAIGRGITSPFERLSEHVALGMPVPVCVDGGMLGNRPWSAHWAIVLRISDAHVVLGNVSTPVVPLDRFLAAWRCRHLPWPHHHCAVLANP